MSPFREVFPTGHVHRASSGAFPARPLGHQQSTQQQRSGCAPDPGGAKTVWLSEETGGKGVRVVS